MNGTGLAPTKRLFQNVSSLALLQLATSAIPLVTVPYLVRVLGVERFGLIGFAQSFAQVLALGIDYGFQLWATREISKHRDDPRRVAQIANAVLVLQLTLFLGLLGALLVVLRLYGRMGAEAAVHLLSYLAAAAAVLFPTWFFQGMERMSLMTSIHVLSRLAGMVALFVIIQAPADYRYVPLVQAVPWMGAFVFAWAIIVRRFRVRLHIPSVSALITTMRESFEFFVSRLSVSFYTQANAFILGLAATNQTVGFYSAAEKLYQASRQLSGPLVQALYPHMTRERNVRFFQRVFYVAVAASALGCGAAVALARPVIVVLYGAGFEPSVGVLRIFAAAALMGIPSSLLGYPLLAALGFAADANRSVIFGAVLHGVGVLAVASWLGLDARSLAWWVLITETTVLVLRAWAIRKHQLWRLGV